MAMTDDEIKLAHEKFCKEYNCGFEIKFKCGDCKKKFRAHLKEIESQRESDLAAKK